MSNKDVNAHLVQAKERFVAYKARQFQPVVQAIAPVGLSQLESLTALREALPQPYTSLREFETARDWSFKRACQVFDRAIKATS